MKTIASSIIAMIAAATLTLAAVGKFAPPRGRPAQATAAIKPAPGQGGAPEPKWFKVLVTYSKTGKERVRYALPMSFIDLISKCVDRETFKLDAQGGYFNLKALFGELKSMGPLIFVEITGTGETIKLWLE